MKKQPKGQFVPFDFKTFARMAETVGYRLVPAKLVRMAEHVPQVLSRDYEDKLLDLCASGNLDPMVWRTHGPSFFMGGLAVLLASARGFERERYLRLADALHPGVTTTPVFDMWLKRSPVRASRFLPRARVRKGLHA